MQSSDPQQGVLDQTSGSDLELKSLLSLLIRRRWIILGVALPIILVSSIVTLRATDKTAASARLMIIGRQPETPDFVRGNINWDLEMSSAAQVVMSLPVARLAAEALFDSLQVLSAEDPTFPVSSTVEDVLYSIGGEIDCSQVGESNILSITYSHIHQRYALAVVEAIIDAYLQFTIKSQQNLPAVEYYVDQIELVQAEIDGLFQERVDIMEQTGVKAMASNTSAVMAQIRQLETHSIEIQSERAALESRVRNIDAAILADPNYIPTLGDRFVSQTLKEHADRLLTELADLRSQMKPGSDRIVTKERQLAEIWKEISRERDDYLRGLRISIEELAQQEQSYIESILAQESALEDYPDVQRRIEIIDMQVTSQLGLLKAMEMKRGEVQLKAGADIRVSNIFPLDAPFITNSLVGSKKSIYLATAAILALVLGIITGWFVDNQDHRIFDRSQAINALEVPVLGSISSDTSDA
jgi:uncharacterized protein involved in exopolysaccharide biosynthesis